MEKVPCTPFFLTHCFHILLFIFKILFGINVPEMLPSLPGSYWLRGGQGALPVILMIIIFSDSVIPSLENKGS